ncbi:hypothetical protein GLOIN_2v1768369 [Rhizophagus irregularis DAOM 181602=DAOM 197198]|uniref:Uncharacterized protein n=1 Tax=Rhizophagus irregularis (strain DAOM 181602 / DAOM 197198 / MUCL 43194) TaxID=747089 RepID=A0A2P4QH17_RHIID|nr:hypothetical protein GLOIN_2v1768369 [Rhizophagus irregularis DAOM 181602=DAOM 197198]POG76906.1 hypothetical protein GLOIN_2v1768369 [Rhizophagus irregularis DAOM 181602=DAOM 197198]GET58529.1 hypothetical protein GLOIN_2v1768369 [Rhizophagus irregularis DAOM 181602=DAOM 197198]|eukprot:XP_025183772.1 hypothetical protein GLOIN_2v1768369 [Rhizophagus irregularis DAOM 181602=DAOM 197198]
MACSKTFSGDIPEVMQNIIKSLHSSILINRNCCFLAIPLLWKDPFSVKYRNNLSHHFIDTYFSFLNENDRDKINKIKFHKSDIIRTSNEKAYNQLITLQDESNKEIRLSFILGFFKNSSITSLNFGSDIPFDLSYDALSHPTQLESLQFKDCDLDSNIFRTLLKIKTPLKIKTLVIKNIQVRKSIEIELFVQKVGYYIKKFDF